MSDILGDQAPISETWLKTNGFRWHQMERQPNKHWLLWIGDAVRGDGSLMDDADIGVEVAHGAYQGRNKQAGWFCWFRSDTAHRYGRFIHLRTLVTTDDVVRLIEGLIGRAFDPADAINGSLRGPEGAARYREQSALLHDRLDQQMLRDGHPWSDIERDEARGRPLIEHVEAAEKARCAGGAR